MAKNHYNETNHKVKPVRVNAEYVRDLRERLKRAQAVYRDEVRRMTPDPMRPCECPCCGHRHR